MIDNLKVRATAAPWWAGIEFVVMNHDGSASGSYVVMEQRERGTVIAPTFRLDMDQAQTLMDDLWNCGIRPTEGTGSAGSLRATEKHLEDMRALVFKKEVNNLKEN